MELKTGQKLKHLRNGDIYKVSRLSKRNTAMIESKKDFVLLHIKDVSLNFKAL